MSLDVYLRHQPVTIPCVCECGHEHSREYAEELYSANITHNLNKMAGEAGIYEALWRPDEHGYTTAEQIIPLLKEGLWRMRTDPERFKRFNAPNGWGIYEHFVPFVEKYLDACERYPHANISVSR